MLGLRPENDQGYYQSIQRTTPQFKKSGKFANQLTGRFFVSGISGSFAKHQKHLHEIKEHEIAQLNPPIESDQLLEDNTNNTNNNNNNNNEENNKPSVIPIRFLPHKKLVRKYTYQPVLEKRQREELRKDAQRLLELEEKLNEIQRIKSLKRQRDRQRRKRKAEYLAATTIQKTFRGYSVRSKQQAVDVLTDFLRSVQANQAIVKFLAALGIVKKFMKKKFPAWQKKHFLRKQAKEVAEDNWLIVTEVASILTAARREVTRDFLDTVFEIGTENVMPQLIEEEKKRRELLKKKQSKKKKGKGMKKPEDFLQFFLTEFDRNADGTASDEDDDDEDDGDEEERSLEELEQDYQAFQRFTATLRSQPYSLNKAPSSSNINLHQSSRYLAAFPPHFQPQSKKKQYDLNDAKTQQLIQRHQQLVNKMEEEQQRRQTLLEKKRSSLTYDQQKKLEEEKKKHQKKKLKEEFLKKLEDEASRRQQFQQRLREVKERKAAEAASQQRETQLMGKEDVLMIQKKLREVQLQRERIFATSNNVNNNNTKKPKSATRNKVVVTESSQPTKKAAVPKVPHRPVETNKKPSEEKIMAAVMRVAVSEEEKARYTELLSKRIKEAKQQKLLEKQQQEVEEQEKKEKLEKFLQKYQEQLKEQKIAMKLKKKEEKRLKKLQKEKERREAGETGEGGDEEKDNDNDQEEGEGELLAHVISSAPEEFKNIMEDFQFDDFMEKPDLIQIYSEDSPKHDLQAFPTEIIPSLPSPGVIDYKQSNHFQASSNIAQPATSLPPQQKKKVVTSKTKANKPADATSEQSIKRFYKINRDIFRMPRHLKSTPYYQHYVKYVKETENIPIDQILSREGGERDKDKDEKEKKRGGEKIAHASPRKELSQSKIKEVVNEVEVQGEEEEEQYGLLEMIQRAQEKKYGAANLPRQQQTVSQSNNTNNTQPQPTQTTQGTTIHKAISQPSLPTISDQKPVIPSSDMAMKHSSSTNQVTSALTVKAPVLKFTHNLPVPTIPTLNSLLTPHHTSSNLPQPTSEAFPLQSLPAPPLETMLNIKQRYGISIDDFATHLPNTTSNTMTAAGNHVSTIKKLKMKKLKAEKEQQTVVKNESNKMKKKENNKEENKKKKTKTSAASPNTLIIPLPRQKKPTRKEITMEGVMEVEGEEEEEGEGHSLAYSHDTLSVNIPSRQRKLSKRYSTPLAPLSSAINTNPATTTTSASSKKKRKESFPTSEEKGAVGAIKKELQEEQSKVKQKISELFDYEQQLQKDYADLKKQFQEKLQHAMMTSSSKGRGDDEEEEMEGGRLEVEVDEEGEVGEESSDSLIMMKGGRQEEVEREDDIMRKSITESYSEQVSNKMMSSSQPKVSTKDLLMEWAIEDAIEKGEINDDDLIALHQQKQLKYSEQGDDDDDDDEEEEDYEEEEERGEVDHEGGEAEGEDYEDEAEEGEEKDMPSEYDDDSYYDRRLNSLRGTSNNPSKPPTALSLSQHPIHEEEGEEDNELDEEEGSFDEDEDEEEYMRDERKEYWKQLLSLDQTAATSSSDKNNNNVSAQTTTQTQLDDYCLSMMNNLNAKISQK